MRTSILFLSAVSLLALDNSFTIHNYNGTGSGDTRKTASSEQASRPFTLHRFFAQGEIPGYPKPRVGGEAAATWQSDVKTRWRDATTTAAISTLTEHSVSGQVLVTTSAAHGVLNLETVTVSGVTGIPSSTSYTAVVLSTTTLILKGLTYAGPYSTSSPSLTVPTYGSVQSALVSFAATVPANDSIVVDFVSDSNPCSSGNQSACDAAGLDEAGMLAFEETTPGAGDGWGFKIEITAAEATKGYSARTMLDAAHFRYWLRGPVVTQVIVEDRSSSYTYDFGWHYTTAGGMVEDGDAKYKSLHPIYVLTFYTGWAGVKGECILENNWIGKSQNQVYDAEILTGGALGTSAWTKSSHTHIARSRWRKTFWSGTQPGDVRTDYNFAYLVYSKALAQYDTSVTAGTYYLISSSPNWWTLYGASDKGEISGNALVTKNMFEGAEEAGIIQGMDLGLLAQGDARFYDMMFGTSLYDSAGSPVAGGGGNSAVESHVGMHYRETTGSNNFCQYSCASGAANTTFGRILSLEHRPTARIGTESGFDDTAVGDVSTGSWTFHPSHAWDTVVVPYLVTGDWYFLEEMQFWAQGFIMQPNAGNSYSNRHGWWGYINEVGYEYRGRAWGVRTLLHATLFTPDATPEKEYLLDKLQGHFAVLEGQLALESGYFGPSFPCTSTDYAPTYTTATYAVAGYDSSKTDLCNRWYWGRATIFANLDSTGPTVTTYGNELGWINVGGVVGTSWLVGNTAKAYKNGVQTYQIPYTLASFSRVADLWAWARPGTERLSQWWFNTLVHPDVNPFQMTVYTSSPTTYQANTAVAVESISNDNPAVVTITGHGWVNGDYVAICCGSSGWASMNTAASGLEITKLTDDTFSVAKNATAYGSYSGQTFYAVKVGADLGYAPTDMAKWADSWVNPALTAFPGYEDDLRSGYQHYVLNTAALLTEWSDTRTTFGTTKPRTGERTWDWLRGKVRYQNWRGDEFKWCMRPNRIRNVRVSGTALYWTAPTGGGCTAGVQTTVFTTSDSSADAAATCSGRACSVSLAEETPGSNYYRITCGNARALGTVTVP